MTMMMVDAERGLADYNEIKKCRNVVNYITGCLKFKMVFEIFSTVENQ
jgi:hypothetical protein